MVAINAPVAQLDRALDYESRGQEFESLRARHFGTGQDFLKAAWLQQAALDVIGNQGVVLSARCGPCSRVSPYAERLIQLSEQARAVVSGGMPQGALKLGALESTTASRLPRILANFHRRYREVRLELTTVPTMTS
jgi:hypothetical protein